ncbi:MAG: PspC domain-containing protein [Actinomycetota bacterium]
MSEAPGRPDEPPERRLTRSRSNRIIAGVCAGLADYLGVDRVLVRIVFVVLAFGAGAGIALYVLAWILIPEEDPNAPSVPRPSPAEPGESARLVFGALLIAIGLVLLIDLLFPGVTRFLWPLALIALGGVIIVRSSAWRR